MTLSQQEIYSGSGRCGSLLPHPCPRGLFSDGQDVDGWKSAGFNLLSSLPVKLKAKHLYKHLYVCGREPQWLQHAALRNLFVCSELGASPAGVFQMFSTSVSGFQGQKQNKCCLTACSDVPDRLWSLLVQVVSESRWTSADTGESTPVTWTQTGHVTR